MNFCIYDESEVWPRIQKDFASRLPLRNLIWKGGLTQAPRFVEQLNIEIQQSPGPALLSIYLLEPTAADADTYKTTIRPKLRQWVSRQNSNNWLIIYLPHQTEPQTGKFLNLRQTLFDRVRSDMQPPKKESQGEHVAILRPELIESWNSVFLVIRDRVVSALENKVSGMAEEIRKMDANRMMPGWNYCRFFVFKEGLVNLYRLMGLREEALAQYDELEALFIQLLESNNLSWFSSFGGSATGDDFIDLLDPTKKEYHSMMVQNTISLFDFRIYLFGCQCQLLVGMEKYQELVDRAEGFIRGFARAMRGPGTGLGEAFVASWTYSTCQNMVEILEGVPINQRSGIEMLAACKAEFLSGARQQLDILGRMYDRLPGAYLRSSSSSSSLPVTTGDTSVTNPVLTEALSTDDKFDQIYLRTCEQATQYYMECGRRRFAWVLKGDMAQLYMCRGQWKQAVRVLEPLVPGETAESLGAMEGRLVYRLVQCLEQLGQTQRCLEHVVALLAYSKLMDREDLVRMLVQLSQETHKVVGSNKTRCIFDVDEQHLAVAGDTDTLAVSVPIRTLGLPGSFQVDRMEMVLVAGNEGDSQLEITLDAQSTKLTGESQVVDFSTDVVSCPGLFRVKCFRIFLGRLEFYLSGGKKPVRLNEHPGAPTICVGCPSDLSIGDSVVKVTVVPSQLPVDPGTMCIHMFGSDGRALLDPQKCRILGQGAEWKDNSLLVKQETAEIILGKLYNTQEVTAFATYFSEGKEHMSVSTHLVEFTLPLRIETAEIDREMVQVQVRCLEDSVFLDSLMVDGTDRLIREQRRYLEKGECQTVICPHTSDKLISVEVRYATRLDTVFGKLSGLVDRLADKYQLLGYRHLILREVKDHLRDNHKVDMPMEAAPAQRHADMRRLMADLQASDLMCTKGTEQPGNNQLRTIGTECVVSTQRYLDVTASLDNDGGFCHLYQPVGYSVKVADLKGVNVVLEDSKQWMVAGAVATSEIKETMRFTLVPLEVGLVRLPQLVGWSEGGEQVKMNLLQDPWCRVLDDCQRVVCFDVNQV